MFLLISELKKNDIWNNLLGYVC